VRTFVNFLRARAAAPQHGFTLIELLIVLMLLAILLLIAFPSYLAFRDRANNNAAQGNIRAVLPAIESYYSDNLTFVGMTPAGLKSTYDQALDTTKYAIPGADLSSTSFCVQSTSNGKTWSKNGPSAAMTNSACP
jgi:prepilin-type N-terminal cleavage/methylation domain-containing protein